MLRITLKKGLAGHNWRNRRTIQSLGIHRVNQTVEHEDTPNIRGMIRPVRDLLLVEEVEGTPAPRLNIAKKAKAARLVTEEQS